MQAQSIAQMFFECAASRGDTPAQLSKSPTAWEACSWQAMSDRVRSIALGLLALEVQLGDRVAILSDSRAEWVQCDLGILATGAITIPIYPSSTDEQTAYILNDSEVCIVFVDTPAQFDKLIMAAKLENGPLKGIELDDAQGVKAVAIQAKADEAAAKVREKMSEEGADRRALWRSFRTVREDTNKEFRALLTEAQQEKFDANVKKQSSRRRGRGRR